MLVAFIRSVALFEPLGDALILVNIEKLFKSMLWQVVLFIFILEMHERLFYIIVLLLF